MGGSSMFSILILVLLFVVMYFLMIRPQKKREKETNAMRAGVQVGDEIITIGGICAKVVKTKEESIIVQVGADKVKFEMMRWAVSKVVKEGSGRVSRDLDDYDEVEESVVNEAKKSKPRRMKKAAVVEEAEDKVDEVIDAVEEKVDDIVDAVEDKVEDVVEEVKDKLDD